MKSTKSRAQGG